MLKSVVSSRVAAYSRWPKWLAAVVASVLAAHAVAKSPSSPKAQVQSAHFTGEEIGIDIAAPLAAAARLHLKTRSTVQPVNFQAPAVDPAAPPSLRLGLEENPCAGMDERPLGEIVIDIEPTSGRRPVDWAERCWDEINQTASPLVAERLWSQSVCHWNATCLCHRPLYFEEINLERHGYGCWEPLQPAASAAHFFGTIPALPYCMAANCPHECIYTLGHYRPGSCPPWRRHWPPCDPVAAAAEGGVLTGLIFAIP